MNRETVLNGLPILLIGRLDSRGIEFSCYEVNNFLVWLLEKAA